jgi:hypothetical protein
MKENKYEDIFDDHLEIARIKFKQIFNRDPSFYELIEYMEELFQYFYD